MRRCASLQAERGAFFRFGTIDPSEGRWKQPLKEVLLDGYIDNEEYFGDEITPEMLRNHLYGTSGSEPEDVHITLNSYGGSCNAATRMYDMIQSYPAHIDVTISGAAASAATVLASAGRSVEMTPGSLYMIHLPSTIAWGNERDLGEAVSLLRACKESILNIYERRCQIPRAELATMIENTTWMDAEAALKYGFIDKVAAPGQTDQPEQSTKAGRSPGNAAMDTNAPSVVNRREAEAKVSAYFDRQHTLRAQARKEPIDRGETPQPNAAPAASSESLVTQSLEAMCPGVSYTQLAKRLELIKN